MHCNDAPVSIYNSVSGGLSMFHLAKTNDILSFFSSLFILST